MSYQPDPPAGVRPMSPLGVPSATPSPPLAAPQYSYGSAPVTPVGPPAIPGKRRKGLLFTGIAVAVLGISAGVVLVAFSGSAKEETVKRFARAPVGCTTTLEFDKSATFTIYIETKGTIGTVDGDCAAGGTTYQRGDDDLPRVSLTLLNSADEEVTLTATDTPNYAVDGFTGQGYQRMDISEPGTYRLTVTSDDTDFAIAVGGKPNVDANAMSLAGVGAATLGLLLGGPMTLLGLRRKKSTPPSSPPAVWQPTPPAAPGWPAQPQATVPGAISTYPSAPFAPTTPVPPPPSPPTGPGWGAPQQ